MFFSKVSYTWLCLLLDMNFMVKIREKACQADLSKGKYRSNTCYALLDAVIDSTGSQSSGKMTMYDSRLFSKVGGFYPPGHQDVEVSTV